MNGLPGQMPKPFQDRMTEVCSKGGAVAGDAEVMKPIRQGHQRMPHKDTSDKLHSKPQGPERDMRSLLFDPAWYLEQHADVAVARLDPVRHYLEHGAAEGRNPNAFFDTKRYLAANPDVRASSLNPFLHFILYGFREGREPSPLLKALPAKEPEKAPAIQMKALKPVEVLPEEKLRQTLLGAMFAAAAETGGDDNLKSTAPMAPVKPSPRPKPRAKKRPQEPAKLG